MYDDDVRIVSYLLISLSVPARYDGNKKGDNSKNST